MIAYPKEGIKMQRTPTKRTRLDIPDTDFKKMILNMKENTEKELKDIRKTVNEQYENLNKDVEILKRNQTELLDLKTMINKIFPRGCQQQIGAS